MDACSGRECNIKGALNDDHNEVDEKCKIKDPKRVLNRHHAVHFIFFLLH